MPLQGPSDTHLMVLGVTEVGGWLRQAWGFPGGDDGSRERGRACGCQGERMEKILGADWVRGLEC